MLDSILRLFIHLSQDVPDNLTRFGIFGHVRELGPGECMVQVVLHRVVFRQIVQVHILASGHIGDGRLSNIHRGYVVPVVVVVVVVGRTEGLGEPPKYA